MLKRLIRRVIGDDLYVRAYRAKLALRMKTRRVLGKEPYPRAQVRVAKERYGRSQSETWWVCPTSLGPESVLYTFGVGTTLDFELSMIDRHGMNVHAFDPTPKAIEWVHAQDFPPQLYFHPYGLADFDGFAEFSPPSKDDSPHYSMVRTAAGDKAAVKGAVYRLRTIMGMLRHDRVDLLRMDIEGGEYAAIKDLLATHIDVDQLLVEFHHRFAEVGNTQTIKAIESLNRAGYWIYHVACTSPDYYFIRVPDTPE